MTFRTRSPHTIRSSIYFLVPFFIFSIASGALALEPKEFDPKGFDALLHKYVREGGVDYAAWKKDGPGELDAFLAAAAGYDPTTTLGKEPRVAFFMNAYNAWAIRQVLDHYPVASPFDIPGFLDKNARKIAGKERTLDAIETELGAIAGHLLNFPYGLCPAAAGWPAVDTTAYTSTDLEARLSARARRFLVDRKTLSLDKETHVLTVPPQLERWRALAEARPNGLPAYFADFMALGDVVELSTGNFTMKALTLDGALNDAKKPGTHGP